MSKLNTCPECRAFFAKFTCALVRGHDECDCPVCQGYCTCEEGAEAPGFDSPREPEWSGFDSPEPDLAEVGLFERGLEWED